MEVCESLNPERRPHLKAALLAGELHRFLCASCGRAGVVDAELLYFDFERRQILITFPFADLPRADACAARAAATFERVLVLQAPRVIRELAPRFLQRVCFGLEDLREKVLLADAGLADVALEELKCRILTVHPEFEQAGILTLRLTGFDPAGALLFVPELLPGSTPPDPPLALAIDRSAYDDIAALGSAEILRGRPGLASGPHVSLLRLGIPEQRSPPA
jgi:hypothetical protein